MIRAIRVWSVGTQRRSNSFSFLQCPGISTYPISLWFNPLLFKGDRRNSLKHWRFPYSKCIISHIAKLFSIPHCNIKYSIPRGKIIQYPTWQYYTVSHMAILYSIPHCKIIQYPTWQDYTVSHMAVLYSIPHGNIIQYPHGKTIQSLKMIYGF